MSVYLYPAAVASAGVLLDIKMCCIHSIRMLLPDFGKLQWSKGMFNVEMLVKHYSCLTIIQLSLQFGCQLSFCPHNYPRHLSVCPAAGPEPAAAAAAAATTAAPAAVPC